MPTTNTQTRDFQLEIKTVQTKVKTQASFREQIVGDARVEESRYKASIDTLKELAVENPHKLTVAQCHALRDASAKTLESQLDTIKAQLEVNDLLIADYNAVSKQ